MSPSVSDAIRFAAARASFDGWTVVEVTGRHRERFLHSQVTSDVRSLPVGESQLSALLDATGRLRSFFHLHKLDDAIRLLVPDEAARATIAGLDQHLVADDVRITALDVGPMTLLLGPAVEQLRRSLPGDRTFPVSGWGAPALVVLGEADLRMPVMTPDELVNRGLLSGLPRWGIEAQPGMLINETSLLHMAVSFSKGCYLGQETVAKVASRRGAARAPVLLRPVARDPAVDRLVGESFSVGDRDRAGIVHSTATWEGTWYLLASLWREFRVEGMEISCAFRDGTPLIAKVTKLPLLATPSPSEVASDLYLRAVELFTDDAEEAAVELLERAVAVCPDYADAYESLGVILGRLGQYEEALGVMDRLLEADPDSVMAHTNRSLYLNQLGRNDEAEEAARAAAAKALELSRRAPLGAVDGGVEQGEGPHQADRSRREEMFRQVLDLDPGDAMANFGIGQLEVERGDFEAAVEHLGQALDADPDYSAAYLALGRAWEGLSDPDRARDTYAAGVRVAARRGDLKTASTMQERLANLGGPGVG